MDKQGGYEDLEQTKDQCERIDTDSNKSMPLKGSGEEWGTSSKKGSAKSDGQKKGRTMEDNEKWLGEKY